MPSKITIIGGGSSTFVPQLMRLFLESEVLAGSTITLMDIDERRLQVMDTLCRRLAEVEGGRLVVESTTDQREALDGATFVITAISVGGMDAWEKDIEIPAKHGVYMAIADSIGPGGIFRAFRHIPVLASVAEDVAELAPDAMVFNYSNPATANTMAMRWVSPSVQSFGLCTCSSIPRHASYLAYDLGVDPMDVVVPAPAAGLNHCAGIIDLRLKDGSDALSLFAEKTTNPISKWALNTFGVIPYCWSHWTEFFPQLMRLTEPYEGKLQGLKMAYNMVVHEMDNERARSKHWEDVTEKLASGEEKVSLDVLPTAEAIEVVEIFEAVLENRNEVHVVNLPNHGAIDNLPDDAIVEVTCLVNAYGISPVHVGPITESWAAVLRRHITTQELTVDAALSGDRDIALEAYTTDPPTATVLMPEQAEALLDEMLEAHADHLPQFGADHEHGCGCGHSH